jgi:hypothetical protein
MWISMGAEQVCVLCESPHHSVDDQRFAFAGMTQTQAALAPWTSCGVLVKRSGSDLPDVLEMPLNCD